MKKIIHFKDAFVNRITRMVKPYDDERIIFDCYDIAQSLKHKMRAKRAQGKEMEFAIHDELEITLKELLSATKTKALLSNILGNVVLDEYKGSKKKVVVVKGTKVQINQPHSLAELMTTRNHEEADTMIPLHVIDTIGDSSLRGIDVWSPDSDVLVVLMDRVAHGRLGAFNKLNFLTGKGDKFRSITFRESSSVIGREKCQGLIGFHNFTGADWGGKCGISKKSWIISYISLPNDGPIVSAFQLLGEGVLTSRGLVDGELPEERRPIEKFV